MLANNFFPETTNFLFRARTRMLEVKNNFKNSFDDDIHLCPLCESDEDTQEHLLKCEMMIDDLDANLNYDDIFGQNTKKQRKTVENLQKAMNQRKQMMENKNDTNQ